MTELKQPLTVLTAVPDHEHVDYEPSYFHDADHVVCLTLGAWRYRGYVITKVGGNCKGASILEAAVEGWIEDVCEHIEGSGGFEGEQEDESLPLGSWDYVFVDPEGTRLVGEVFGEHGDVRRELEGMVLAATIISFGGKLVEEHRARMRERGEGGDSGEEE